MGDERQAGVLEAARLDAVRRYAILDTPPDGAFDRVTRLAAQIFDVPISTVSIVDHDRIWFKARYGIDAEQIDREPGLCASAVLQDGPWVVSDAEVDPRTLDNPLVRGELGLRFYAGVPLRTSDGHNLGTLNVIDTEPRQVSDRELALLEELAAIVVDELELRLAAREEAERSTRARGDFVVTAAHELRTPLAAVYGAAQLLGRDGVADERERAKLLAVIAEESERLSVVVGAILTGAQLDAGHVAIASGRCEPNVLAAAAVAAARAHLPANLTVELGEAEEVRELDSDAARIRQILASLLENAVKYSPDGGRIEVAVEPLEAGIRFSVSDEGIGIRVEDAERVFERFTRLDAHQTRGVGGTGLGLHIARELAGLLGGSLSYLPRPGRGSTFVLDLPL